MNYYERISYDPESGRFTWLVSAPGIRAGSIAGCRTLQGYWQIRLGGKTYRAHRLAWFLFYGIWPSGDIDHINGDRIDNRIANLREVTHGQNMQNQRLPHSDSASGFLGVTWNKQHRRWQSKIQANKKMHHVGYFDTPIAAHEAYLLKKRELHIAAEPEVCH